MSQFEMWKLQREVARLGRQLARAPRVLYEAQVTARLYDLQRARLLSVAEGALPGARRVAIHLLFPSEGVLASHLMALRYIADQGYAPLVVSNLPLSVEDRATLAAHSWRLMERPNFGYDFGGYRDAVLWLGPHLATLDRLAILNDSTWFPLPGSEDWFAAAEALDVDFAGATSHFGAPRVGLDDLPEFHWSFTTTSRNFHYASYALLLRPAAFRHPEFLGFWRRMRCSSQFKNRTVRQGEIGLTQWAIRHGLSHGATLDLAHLDTELAALPDDRLAEIAASVVVLDAPQFRVHQREALDGNADRETLISLILYAVSRFGAAYALAPYSVPVAKFPFLKKSPLWLERQSSDTTLQIAADLPGLEGRMILEEARQLRRTRGAALDTPAGTEAAA